MPERPEKHLLCDILCVRVAVNLVVHVSVDHLLVLVDQRTKRIGVSRQALLYQLAVFRTHSHASSWST